MTRRPRPRTAAGPAGGHAALRRFPFLCSCASDNFFGSVLPFTDSFFS